MNPRQRQVRNSLRSLCCSLNGACDNWAFSPRLCSPGLDLSFPFALSFTLWFHQGTSLKWYHQEEIQSVSSSFLLEWSFTAEMTAQSAPFFHVFDEFVRQCQSYTVKSGFNHRLGFHLVLFLAWFLHRLHHILLLLSAVSRDQTMCQWIVGSFSNPHPDVTSPTLFPSTVGCNATNTFPEVHSLYMRGGDCSQAKRKFSKTQAMDPTDHHV